MRYKNGNSCAIIRTIENACAFSLLRTRGSFYIGFSFSLKSIALSSSSEPLLSSFVALHVAGHIYTYDTPCNTTFYHLPSVYVTLVRTMELAFYRSLSTLHAMLLHTMEPAFYHSLSVHATLIHTMGATFCHSPSVHT